MPSDAVPVGDHGVFVTTDGLTIRRSEEVAEPLARLLADAPASPE